MRNAPDHIRAMTSHKRRGAVSNGFTYGADFVLIDPAKLAGFPKLFSRNKFNLNSVHDTDHGGPLKSGQGLKWARHALFEQGLTSPKIQIHLLTQPRFLTYSFNPASFWLAFDGSGLVAVICEVSTPFGHRHSYLCHLPDFTPITKGNRIGKPKVLHVSPFQDVAGGYEFTFDITPSYIDIRIIYRNGKEGVIATLQGAREPMTNWGFLKANARRPLGALRTMTLIHWQALKLKLKGAKYRSTPTPPTTEVS
jgi:DUF1365 family protein